MSAETKYNQQANKAILTISFHSYWRCGTGASGAGNYDDVAMRHPQTGLPYVPAKHFKGLLNEVARRILSSHEFEKILLFGSGPHSYPHYAGSLNFRDAIPHADIIDWVNEAGTGKEKRQRAETLFSRQASTSINHEKGVSEEKMLRSFEVVAPITLTAEVFWNPSREARQQEELMQRMENNVKGQPNWVSLLNDIASFVTNVGSLKNDGYGDAQLTVIASTEEAS